jgi:hypothetical protein
MDRNGANEFGEILKVERKALWWSVLGGNGLVLLAAGQWVLVNLMSSLQMPLAELLRAVSIVLYLGCWILGSNFDANAQRQVYWNTKSSSKAIGSIYPIVVGLVTAGGVLLWANGSEKYFALSLSIFLAVNVVSWIAFVGISRPIIQASEITYRRFLPYKLDSLAAVTAYITGRWQWLRFTAMLGVIVLLDAVCFLPKFAHYLAVQIAIVNRIWQVDAITYFLPTFLVILFMLVGEVWGWLMRLRVHLALKHASDQLVSNGGVNELRVPEDEFSPGYDDELQNKRMVQSFKSQLAVPKFLWAAHGAGLIACVKYLLDRSSSDALQFGGISLFICVFAAGFVLAALGYAALKISQNTVLDALWFKVPTRTNSVKAAAKGWFDIVVSLLLLGAGMVALVIRAVT